MLSYLFIWQLWLRSRKQQMEQTEFSELLPMESPARHQLRQCGLNTQPSLHLQQQKQPQPGTSMEIAAITGCLADVFNFLGCWPTSVAEGRVSLEGKHTEHERSCALSLTCPRWTLIIKQLQEGTKDTGAAWQVLLRGKINKHKPRSDLRVVMWVTTACGSSYNSHFKAPSVPS